MCGIAGYLGGSVGGDRARALLQGMISAIAHRGPDGRGMLIDGPVALGHARLSIIDLVGGTQPMTDETGNFAITFNGEIFNYIELRREAEARGARFRTQSDTEVILQLYTLYGEGCVEHLNGDFAFAIWDRHRGRLMLARDRMGVRPLYYAHRGGQLSFASEIKALLALPGIDARMDPIALDQIFSLWLTLPPRTAFEGILELPPGHLLLATPDHVAVRRYWRLNFPRIGEEPAPQSESEYAEELRALLDDAVRIRLRADVPVGAYLSGGLDSSIVAAVAQNAVGKRLHTFSVTFEESEFDESAQQREIATALGTRNHVQRFTAAEVGEMLPAVVRHAERPLLRTAPGPMLGLSSLVRSCGFKVVLTGEGADEIFAGYDIFKEAKLRAFCARQPGSRLRPLLFRRLYTYLPSLQAQTPAYLEAFFCARLDRVGDPLFSHQPRFATAAGAKLLFSDELRAQLAGYDALDELRGDLPTDFSRWHPLHQAQYLEGAYLLPGYILSAQGDRVAMANAVEGRFPFLDHRLVEFASSIPPSLKLRGMQEKHILRRSVRSLLPDTAVNRPKQPYRAPDSQCFFGPNAPRYASELLSPGSITSVGLFDAPAVERLARKAARGAGGVRDAQSLVGVLSTQLWHQTFVVHARPATATPQFDRLVQETRA